MHHSRTAVLAATTAEVNQHQFSMDARQAVGKGGGRGLTLNRGRPLAVVQDGQLAKHVPGGQGSKFATRLGDTQLTVWRGRRKQDKEMISKSIENFSFYFFLKGS